MSCSLRCGRSSPTDRYRLMTVGTLRGVARAAGAKAPTVEIVRWSSDSLDVDVFA